MAELFESGRPDPFYALFVRYLITVCSRLETASDVISDRFVGPVVPISLQNFMVLTRTFLEKFHPKQSEATFSTFFFQDNFRPEVISDVISGVVEGPNGIKFGDSR